MPRVDSLDSTVEAMLVEVAVVAISIVAARIVLGLPKASAEIKLKGIRFDGAAAMFVAVFFLLD